MFGGPSLPETIELSSLGGRGLKIPVGALSTMRAENSGDLNGDGRGDFAFSKRRSRFGADETIPATVYVIYGRGGFRRGDVNTDGEWDISDPIVILGYQFLGVPPILACEKSADVDDSGEVDITDAVNLLLHLFVGGAPIPEPFTDCDSDPTPDTLTCEAYPPCQSIQK